MRPPIFQPSGLRGGPSGDELNQALGKLGLCLLGSGIAGYFIWRFLLRD